MMHAMSAIGGLLAVALAAPPAVSTGWADAPFEMVDIPGGSFEMGDADGRPDEAPRMATVSPFRLMLFEVTNAQFAAFVAETGHVTDPERRGFGYVWPGRWTKVPGADWRHRSGPASNPIGLDDHPVVQVSWRDAGAFCRHHGLRLPSEEGWEFAARGTDGRIFPWGDTYDPALLNSHDAGPFDTVPVGSFPAGASPYGLLDAAGMVFEWTASPGNPGRFLVKGGSWDDSGCGVCRPAARHARPADIKHILVGFRLVLEPSEGE